MTLCRVYEPAAEITNPEEFAKALKDFAKDEHKDLEIIDLSMTPRIRLDGKEYVCRLQAADLAVTENPFQRAFGMIDDSPNHKVIGIYREEVLQD
ncbi:hypothetical protein CL176_03140 [Suicoccus acidiformans]|uniref:Uncharacterized protein n=1 Tax=Suicoccus acidiformans TaxID=2036206 RepID=A0A347WJ46_9LACT|nr:hypothetical protein [Suicoccus acidiformans]AXY25103.1 hypothetical protein CL176_03140 [Suicoccus acidiformans]